MRAAIFTGPGEVRIDEVPMPVPGVGEVRVRLEGCGVCASNLAHWEGMPWSQYPMEPGAMGHEAWGVIDKLGPNVSEFAVGDRVVGLSYRSYAEFDIMKADSLLKLPDGIWPTPFPGEPLGCAFNIFRRSEIYEGHTVGIVGIGFLGALLTAIATRAGARVIAISRRPFSLDIAKKMGATDLIPMDDHGKIIEQVADLTNGKFCDRVIEAVGKQWPLDLSSEIVRERGRLMIAGYHQDGPRQVNMQLWNWRGIDVVNAHERDSKEYVQGIRAAMDAVVNKKVDPTPLYTHRFTLDQLGEALDATRDRPDGFLKALVVFE